MRSWLLSLLGPALLLVACDAPAAKEPTPASKTSASRNDASPDAMPKPGAHCDPVKIIALVGSLRAAGDEAKGELVAKQLGEACTLPPSLSQFLADSAELYRPYRSSYFLGGSDLERFSGVCPNAKVISAQLHQRPASERLGALYDRCDFGRLGLIEKSEWLLGRPRSRMPWEGYQWLRDQGVDEAAAKVITTALLWRDRTPWHVQGQTLPRAESVLSISRDAPLLTVTLDAIQHDAQTLVKLKGGALAEDGILDHLVGSVFDALALDADRARDVARPVGESWDGTLLVAADAAVPHATVVDVLYSAGRAGFSQYEFVLKTGVGRYGAVKVSAPMSVGAHEGATVAALDVQIGAEGFRVRTGGSTKGRALLARSADGTLDMQALADTASAHKIANPGADAAVVAADNSTPYGETARTMAVLRGERCDATGKDCMLPRLTLTAEGIPTWPTGSARGN